MKIVKWQKAGSGLIVMMVLTVVFLLATIVLYQSSHTSAVTHDTDTLLRGDVLQNLVNSAAEEAGAKLEYLFNEPKSPVFSMIRQVVYRPDVGEYDFSEYVSTPELTAIIASSEYAQYKVEAPEVKVVLQRQLDKTEYERFGIVTLRVTGTSGGILGRQVKRRIEFARAFKVALTTVPRPFDTYGIYYANAEGVTDTNSVNDSRQRLISLNDELWSSLKRAKVENVLEEGAEMKALEGRLLPQNQARERVNELAQLKGGALLGLYYPGVSLKLNTLDLAEYLRALVSKAERALRRTKTLTRQEEFVPAASMTNELVYEGLWRIWAHKEAFRLIKTSDEAYNALQHYHFSFEKDFWRKRIQYKVEKRANEESFSAAWQRYRKDHPTLRGVISTNNDVPLYLTGKITGSAVIVVGPGGAIIHDLNKSGGPKDLLTIVSYAGPIHIKGECHCSLFLCKPNGAERPEVNIPADATLLGNLVSWSPPLATSLQGMIKRDMRYVSGFNGDKGQVVLNNHLLHVAFSPKTIYRKVKRN